MHVGDFDFAITDLTRRFNREVAVIALGQAMMNGVAVLRDTEIVFDSGSLSFGIEWNSGIRVDAIPEEHPD